MGYLKNARADVNVAAARRMINIFPASKKNLPLSLHPSSFPRVSLSLAHEAVYCTITTECQGLDSARVLKLKNRGVRENSTSFCQHAVEKNKYYAVKREKSLCYYTPWSCAQLHRQCALIYLPYIYVYTVYYIHFCCVLHTRFYVYELPQGKNSLIKKRQEEKKIQSPLEIYNIDFPYFRIYKDFFFYKRSKCTTKGYLLSYT